MAKGEKRLLEEIDRERDRMVVLYFQKKAMECAMASVQFPDNIYIRKAVNHALKDFASSLQDFMDKHGTMPIVSVRLKSKSEED